MPKVNKVSKKRTAVKKKKPVETKKVKTVVETKPREELKPDALVTRALTDIKPQQFVEFLTKWVPDKVDSYSISEVTPITFRIVTTKNEFVMITVDAHKENGSLLTLTDYNPKDRYTYALDDVVDYLSVAHANYTKHTSQAKRASAAHKATMDEQHKKAIAARTDGASA